MARGFTRRPNVRGSRRATQWIGSADSNNKASLAAGDTVLDQTFAFAEPATIIRVRGSLWVGSDQAAVTEEPFGALGFTIASDAAAAVGVGSVETPIVDEASDNWYVWMPFLSSVNFVSAVGTEFNYMARHDFDSKAMRKVDDGDTNCVVLENASAGDGLVYILKFRMLVKLHG